MAHREIKILKNLKHDNIVRLKEIVTSKAGDHNKQTGSVFMVFEYAEHDLAGLILNQRVRLEKQHVKSYLKQLLDGLHYLHKQKILWDSIQRPYPTTPHHATPRHATPRTYHATHLLRRTPNVYHAALLLSPGFIFSPSCCFPHEWHINVRVRTRCVRTLA